MKMKIIAIFHIYLLGYTYASGAIQTINLETLNYDANFIPNESAIDYTGPTNCTYVNRYYYIANGNSTVRIYDKNNKTICNKSQFYNDGINQLSLLQKRYVPNPTLVKYSVELVGGTVFEGAITLATAGTVTLVAAALVAGWYGLSALRGTSTQTVTDKRDIPIPIIDTLNSNIKRDTSVYVCYADDTDTSHYVQDVVNNNESYDTNAANGCIQALDDYYSDLAGGYCNVQFEGSEGVDYDATIGIATMSVDETDFTNECTFHSYRK